MRGLENLKLINNGPIFTDNNDTVLISLVADGDTSIDSLQAYFPPAPNEYMTLIDISTALSGNNIDTTSDVANGLIWLVGVGGVNLSSNEAVFTAKYKVREDTPIGEYPVTLDFTTLSHPNDDSAIHPEPLVTTVAVAQSEQPTPTPDEGSESSSTDSTTISSPDTGSYPTNPPSSIPSFLLLAIVLLLAIILGFRKINRS